MEEAIKPRRQSFQSKKPHKEIRFGSYVLGSTLGEGEFGKVKLGWKKDGTQPSQVAIKFIRRESIPRGSERESKVHREINALKRLSHPNIIKLEEVLQNDKYIGIVLEYASGGELFDYILQHRYLKDSLACRLFAQLISGVYYMHSKGIVHRDLKLENLLLDKHKNIIITDFGFVNSFGVNHELMKTSCGSPCYAAPELVISNEPYEGRKADVWSCGVILYAMLSGYLPFDDDPQNPDGDNIARLYQYITTTHLTFPEYVEPMSRDLLRRILVPNPRKRMNLREVRSHQWLSAHAPFLSVTPSEWDISHKSTVPQPSYQQRSSSIPKNEFRRYSLIDTTPSSMNNNSNSSINHSNNTFFANPLPPQTSSSHAIVLPASTSSTSINEQLKQSPRGHQRSNSVQSTASLALQAVVDADEVRHQQLPSSSSSYSIDKIHRENKKPTHLQQGIPKSTTHTGITTLGNFKEQLINSTIEESPVKLPTQKDFNNNNSNDGFMKPKIPINSNNFSSPTASTLKLPGGPRKPRPTSYHPGLYSSQNQSQHNLDYQFHNPFVRSESTTSIVSMNNKISKPSVDLASASGDIITPKSPTLLNANVYQTNSNEEVPIAEKSGETIVEKNADVEDKNSGKIVTDSKDEEKASNTTITSTTSNTKKTNRYSAVIAAELVFDKIFGSSPQQDVGNESLIKLNSQASSIHSNQRSNISTNTKNTSVQASPQDQVRKPSSSLSPQDQVRKSSSTSQHNHSVKSHEHSSSYHSKSKAHSNLNANNYKTKRFSFLGFYTPSNDNADLESAHSSKSKKKVLEPSNDLNIITNKANNKSTLPNKRDSIVSYTSFAPKKEPSTAKKVMDFFKRRSMRVG